MALWSPSWPILPRVTVHGLAFAAHDLRKRGATGARGRRGCEDAAEARNERERRAGERAGDSTGGAAD